MVRYAGVRYPDPGAWVIFEDVSGLKGDPRPHLGRCGHTQVVRVTGVVVKIVGVEFFCYHRGSTRPVALREELLEEHWSYMDRYEAEMIARGPTLTGEAGAHRQRAHRRPVRSCCRA